MEEEYEIGQMAEGHPPARFLDTDPEDALHAACDKFSIRFRRTEQLAGSRGLRLDELSDTEQIALWNEAKEHPQ